MHGDGSLVYKMPETGGNSEWGEQGSLMDTHMRRYDYMVSIFYISHVPYQGSVLKCMPMTLADLRPPRYEAEFLDC